MRGERKGRDQGRVASSRESRRRRRSGPPFPVARGLAGFGDAEPRVGSVRGSGPGPLLVETFPLFFFSFFLKKKDRTFFIFGEVTRDGMSWFAQKIIR